jgi:hypothetical protein
MRFVAGFFITLVACAPDDPVVEHTAELDVADLWLPFDTQAPVYLVGEDGAAFSPVHATLLPDQRVMLLGLSVGGGTTKAALFTPTPADQFPPPYQVVDSQPIPLEAERVPIDGYTVDDTPFCAGQTLLADGSLFIAGGTRGITQGATTYMFGVDYGITYRAGTWARIEDRMKSVAQQGEPIRWYPSTTRLADGKVLVTGGRDYVATLWNGNFVDVGTENISADLYDPATQTFRTASAYGATPAAIFNGDYSHVFQLPTSDPHDVLVFGERAEPLRFDVETASWIETHNYRPGTAVDGTGTPVEAPNNGASTAMLPIRVANGDRGYSNGSVVVVGGTHNRAHEHSYDVYDPAANQWHPRRDLGIRRHHPSTVLLPDGNLLVLAGHDDALANADPLLRRAQLVDTAAGFTLANGSALMGEARGYHNIALLLPDGRVLVGGGRDAGPDSTANEKPTIRYYYPPYMFRPRPALGWSPARVAYGEGFWILHDRPVTDAVLIALGSMTHSIDMNQRAVQVQLYPASETASVLVAPPNAATAPPGHYMLFVLDANRTPSLARIIEIGT